MFVYLQSGVFFFFFYFCESESISCSVVSDSHSPPGSSGHGTLQARVLEWVAISFSRGSSRPGDWTRVSRITGRFFAIWATREASSLKQPENSSPLQYFRVYLRQSWKSAQLVFLCAPGRGWVPAVQSNQSTGGRSFISCFRASLFCPEVASFSSTSARSLAAFRSSLDSAAWAAALRQLLFVHRRDVPTLWQ